MKRRRLLCTTARLRPKKWVITLRGPKDSPYETGNFKLDVSFPDDFPFAAPAIHFRTKIYHPNIDSNSGTIAWSPANEEWSPAWHMDKILIMLSSLLSAPDPRPGCEIVPEIGHEWRERRDVYWQTAKEWTEKYAM
ncbi:hypothetical protein ACJBU6_09961 [Exserohilum turcicum]